MVVIAPLTAGIVSRSHIPPLIRLSFIIDICEFAILGIKASNKQIFVAKKYLSDFDFFLNFVMVDGICVICV